MSVSASAAFWFLPFVLPICFYVSFTDLREMRITNQAVLLLAAVFVLVGPIILPLTAYGMGLVQMGAVLVIGIILNAAGAVGAGDAKFAAAAAPFIAVGDLRLLIAIFAANLMAAFFSHRLAKHSPLRRIAPGWKSWDAGLKFPMGLSLGGTLAIYLILGANFGL
ncbi:prepilin peptidase [Sedimentitalea nanhaiensis]|uniref:Prepilin peptidase CpaA n=1 Tax=Sedimentitalea nanhaiensis TaxID=999627 RepID=A0A1I7AX99_9RHOB|nr:prepilin peptidase [Sedimentitalea nanhaiensis]SFT79558.1 prepilin peptidase CpaA [Sedimentitalea nanhaiensis]